jgi:hypothetical protein
MALQKRDKEFRLSKISYLDFKFTEMDRVLTNLFSRIQHKGYPSRLRQGRENTVELFVEHFIAQPTRFKGFAENREVVNRWVETHLMDLVNRAKSNPAVAAPRPLHGYTYRFRNPYHCRDYGCSQQIYEMLHHARGGRGEIALQRLKSFFFEGIDPNTQEYDPGIEVDVETQALLALTQRDVVQDTPDTANREQYPPLCIGAADLLADDLIRLLVYKKHIPRSVMVDYVKVLLSFHLALYHLRLLKLLPALVRKHGIDASCGLSKCQFEVRNESNPQSNCPYRIGLLLDVANRPGTHIAALAEQSADIHYRRIPMFVKAYFTTKKLDEFGLNLLIQGKLLGGPDRRLTIAEVLGLLDSEYDGERDIFFGMRLASLLEHAMDQNDELDSRLREIGELGLGKLDAYIESIVAFRAKFHRDYLVECLDSLLLKNKAGALLAQTRKRAAPRRFILDSRLLEVLLQIAVLKVRTEGPLGYQAEEIKVEDLLSWFRDRYGLYIDRLPLGEGFEEPSIEDREALRYNKESFKTKLREIGFFQDLSDAYITQHVTPRYRIGRNI